MQGFQLNSRALVLSLACLLCLLSYNSVDAVYSMAQTCMYVPNNTFIGDPNACAGWGYCRNNQLAATGTCPGDLLYNTRTGRCDYPSNVQCSTTYQEICATFKTSQWVADPNNCQNYCYCNSTSVQCALCPSGQYFQESTTDSVPACVWDTTFECQADSVCRLVPDNTFVQSPETCGQYLSCYNGVSQIPASNCPSGYTYNGLTGTCSTTDNCSGQNVPPTSIGPFPQNATACTGVADGTYISDGQTCAGYYYCDSTNPSSNGMWGKCPVGTHFNPKATATNGQCVTPYTYICPYNRCMNIDQLYMAEEGCLTFDYCQNQQVKISGYKCSDVSATNIYYNEFYDLCQATMPDYPICTGTPAAAATGATTVAATTVAATTPATTTVAAG